MRPGVRSLQLYYLNERIDAKSIQDEALEALLYDPQTSGGLLIAIGEDQADQLFECFCRQQLPIWRIGRVNDGNGLRVTI